MVGWDGDGSADAVLWIWGQRRPQQALAIAHVVALREVAAAVAAVVAVVRADGVAVVRALAAAVAAA
eukprot:6926800-Alexandrium_andersonii.AAC.1